MLPAAQEQIPAAINNSAKHPKVPFERCSFPYIIKPFLSVLVYILPITLL